MAVRKDTHGLPALLDVETDGELVSELLRKEFAGNLELVLALDAGAGAKAVEFAEVIPAPAGAVHVARPFVHARLVGADLGAVRIDEAFEQEFGASVGELVAITAGGSVTVRVDVAVERNVLHVGLMGDLVLVPLEVDKHVHRVGIHLHDLEGRLRGLGIALGLSDVGRGKLGPVGEVAIDLDGSDVLGLVAAFILIVVVVLVAGDGDHQDGSRHGKKSQDLFHDLCFLRVIKC